MQFEETFIGRPNTLRAYRSLFKTHIAPLNITPEEVKHPHWDPKWTLNNWKEKGLAVKTRLILLRLFRDYIKHLGGPTLNIKPLQSIISREEQQAELTVLTPLQAKELMDACKRLEPKFYPILLLALHAGLRRGEIFGLKCGDVDLLRGKVRVARSYEGPTKNGRTRYVPMSKELIEAMTAARNAPMRKPDERIFEIMDPNPVLRRLCYAIKAPIMRFHDLRHAFATLALEGGISPKTVQSWLGHSNVTTTLNIYWNLTKDEADVNSFLPGGNNG